MVFEKKKEDGLSGVESVEYQSGKETQEASNYEEALKEVEPVEYQPAKAQSIGARLGQLAGNLGGAISEYREKKRMENQAKEQMPQEEMAQERAPVRAQMPRKVERRYVGTPEIRHPSIPQKRYERVVRAQVGAAHMMGQPAKPPSVMGGGFNAVGTQGPTFGMSNAGFSFGFNSIGEKGKKSKFGQMFGPKLGKGFGSFGKGGILGLYSKKKKR